MNGTETLRRALVAEINGNPQIRSKLKETYGQVWDTHELQRDFTVDSFMAPFVSVVRKADGARGLLTFQHAPRFYFDFHPSGV